MNPENVIKSDALEANMQQTDPGKIEIPEQHLWFANLSKDYYSLHTRANDCITEYNHPYSNNTYVITQLRNISLGDFWFYEKNEHSKKAFHIILEIFEGLLSGELTLTEGEDAIHTLLELAEKMLESAELQSDVLNRAIALLQQSAQTQTKALIHNSTFLQRVFTTQTEGETGEAILQLIRQTLIANAEYWRDTTQVEKWLAERRKLFSPATRKQFTLINKSYFEDIIKQTNEAQTAQELSVIPGFNEVSLHIRQLHHGFERFHEKFFYLIYLLHLDGMQNQKEILLRDFNNLLRNIKSELSSDEVFGFLDNIFRLFNDLKQSNPGTVLDCILTLGKEIFRTENDRHISHFEKLLLRFGFISPGKVFVSDDWQLTVNENHIKNIRVWLELIEYSPLTFRDLLSALIIHLRLGGVFISDTDLFQRDITGLLNADIKPIFKHIKQLARLFPVYFNEIGAEGELREITTSMDELSHRNDRLIHFLRKQIHTESNNTHIELARNIVQYWYDGNAEHLNPLVPRDVQFYLSEKGRWFTGANEMMQQLCQVFNCGPEHLSTVPSHRIRKRLNELPGDNTIDKHRLYSLFRLLELLREKYSFNTVNLSTLMQKSGFFKLTEIENLTHLLDHSAPDRALRQVYLFMRQLNTVITDEVKTEGWEDIYHKRHIAIGIPSMYGKYREPKFEAMGLTFRLEKLAAHLMDLLIDSINLDYITAKTLRRIHVVIELFRQGLELDGVSDQGFNSNLKMFRFSLNSASFSVGQYINILQFMLSSVREIISKYFLRVYDAQLRIIIPQLFPDEIKADAAQGKQFIVKKSEEFYREMLSSAFLVQMLDAFLVRILNSFRQMVDNYPEETIRSIMSYNTDLVISPLNRESAEMDNKIFLGSKAYFLKKLSLLDFPIPPGFVLTTEIFRRREAILSNPHIEKELDQMVRKQITNLERITGQQFGNPNNPLLLSVRSGTAISMPGAMNTYLNVGLNDDIVETLSKQPNFAWTSWDCYRRFLQSWGMAYGISRDVFDQVMIDFKLKYSVGQKVEFTGMQMREMAFTYKDILQKHNIHFNEEPYQQLKQVIFNVLSSWDSDRAIVYREHLQIADEWGTAVIVQKMVLGNLHYHSGTGVMFTHAPDMEQPGINLYGDFTFCSQGEDIVAGLVNPLPITERQRKSGSAEKNESLQLRLPGIYQRLLEIAEDLTEKHGFSHQEIEFTFESENPEDLYILQTRDQDIRKPDLSFVFDCKPAELKLLGRGIGLGRGVLNGILAFDRHDLEKYKELNDQKILVRPDTVPDDIGMIFECDGLITARGGATSHAAVTAARLDKTCVVNCSEMVVNEKEKTCTFNGHVLYPGDKIAIDGNLGNIYLGNYPVKLAEIV